VIVNLLSNYQNFAFSSLYEEDSIVAPDSMRKCMTQRGGVLGNPYVPCTNTGVSSLISSTETTISATAVRGGEPPSLAVT
jgi:hypothetical protein